MQAQDEQLLQAVKKALQQEAKFQQILEQAKVKSFAGLILCVTSAMGLSSMDTQSWMCYRLMHQLQSIPLLSSRPVS